MQNGGKGGRRRISKTGLGTIALLFIAAVVLFVDPARIRGAGSRGARDRESREQEVERARLEQTNRWPESGSDVRREVAGLENEEANGETPPGNRLSGHVVDVDGAPVPGAQLQLLGIQGIPCGPIAESDGQGAFRLELGPLRAPSLRATNAGYATTRFDLPLLGRGEALDSLLIRDDLRIVMLPGTSVAARFVWDDDGAPCGGLYAWVTPAAGANGARRTNIAATLLQADDEGRLTLEGLPRTELFGVSVSVDGDRELDRFLLDLDGTGTGITLTVKRLGTLHLAIDGSERWLTRAGFLRLEREKVQEKLDVPFERWDGRYTRLRRGVPYSLTFLVKGFMPVELDPSIVLVEVEEYRRYRLPELQPLTPELMAAWEKSRAETWNLEWLLYERGRDDPVTPEALVRAGISAVDLRLRWESADGTVGTTRPDLELITAADPLAAPVRLRGQAPASLRLFYADGMLAELRDLWPGDKARMVIDLAQLAAGRTAVRFLAYDRHGGELGLHRVTLRARGESGGSVMARPVPSEDGSKGGVVCYLHPGNYGFVAACAGWPDARGEITVAPDEEQVVRVEFSPAAAVRGHVLPSPARATVQALLSSTEEPEREPPSTPVGPDGSYRIEGLPEGEVELVLLSTAGDGAIRAARSHVRVRAGEVTEHDIHWEPTSHGSSLVITLSGLDSWPPPSAIVVLEGVDGSTLYHGVTKDGSRVSVDGEVAAAVAVPLVADDGSYGPRPEQARRALPTSVDGGLRLSFDFRP